MRRGICLISILLLICASAQAKRVAPERLWPEEARTAVFDGVRYEAPTDHMGSIFAYDEQTGEELWEKKLYTVIYDPLLEKDVQDVFIKEMRVENHKGWDALVAVDELDRTHEIVINGKRDMAVKPGERVEVTTQYGIDDEGGQFILVNDEVPFRRIDQFLPIVDTANISKLMLVPLPDTEWRDSFFDDRGRLIEAARKNRYLFELKMACYDFCREDGTVSYLYDYQDPNVSIKTPKSLYNAGEDVDFTVVNAAKHDKYFQVVSVEKLKDGEWTLLNWNAPCGCDKCDYVGTVEAGQETAMTWDQSFIGDECETAGEGQYRFVIEEMMGTLEDDPYTYYYSTVMSNVFVIK